MPARPPRNSVTILAIAIVIAAALLSPVGAVAAGQLVEISSVSGRKADVTRAEQLQTAEASPHQFVRGVSATSGGSCATLLTAPSTKAIVVKTVVVDIYSATNPGFVLLSVATGATCGTNYVMGVDVDSRGVTELHFEPGVVVPANARFTALANSVGAEVSAYGYKVTDTAVPATVADASPPDRPVQ